MDTKYAPSRGGRRFEINVHKLHGVIHVEKVGAEHFGIASVDCYPAHDGGTQSTGTRTRSGAIKFTGRQGGAKAAWILSASILERAINLHEQAVKVLIGDDVCGDILIDKTLPESAVISVDLGRSLATDGILAHLINLRSFQYLYLDQTAVTDKVMEVLQAHPEVKRLNIGDTAITDGGLEFLKFAINLEDLTLGEKITDKGFQNVAALTKLRVLHIGRTQVTSGGLAVVADLEFLNFVGLNSRQVDSQGIVYLKQLKALQTINLVDVGSLSDPAYVALKSAIPQVAIEC